MNVDLLGFLAVVGIAYLIPGPDLVVISRFAARSRRSGNAAALGAQTGLCLHMLLACAGLSTLAANSATAFTAIKTLGAIYLIALGFRTALSGGRTPLRAANATPRADPVPDTQRLLRPFRAAFITNALNPKAALFFLSVLPQFIDTRLPAGPQILLLGFIDIVAGVLYWGLVVLLVRRALPRLNRPRLWQWRHQVAGGAMVGAGALLLRADGERA
ncbi:LysE family translocator [Billgrantia saliphila]|uniref:LysE family translocator n=1 Tax=Billgrantia saliphila TaxID=1848458 RepID=UPI0012DEE413|nr:LysE family translocator [Halomonas saliphila]